jgi:hypothetical protein
MIKKDFLFENCYLELHTLENASQNSTFAAVLRETSS